MAPFVSSPYRRNAVRAALRWVAGIVYSQHSTAVEAMRERPAGAGAEGAHAGLPHVADGLLDACRAGIADVVVGQRDGVDTSAGEAGETDEFVAPTVIVIGSVKAVRKPAWFGLAWI